jgi:hypothetical protein
MLRIGELKNWTGLKDGESCEFRSEREDARQIILRVNSNAPLSLHLAPLILDADGKALPLKKGDDVVLLSHTTGLEVVEFYQAGNFRIVAEGNGYVQCKDGQMVHVLATDDRTFTTIAERRAVDYRFELARRVSEENMERRLALLLEERVRLEKLEEENVPAPESPAKPASAKAKPSGSAGAAEPAPVESGAVSDGGAS